MLAHFVKPGQKVYTQVHRVSRSGMSRTISVHVIAHNHDGETWIQNISAYVAKALGWAIDRKDLSIKVSGCGMDMGFHVVYCLGRTLFADGFQCAGASRVHTCPSNEHSNGDRNYEPHKHTDGGYALRQEWL